MERTPNILFIMADQLRYDSLGCTGHPVVLTPNIDKLASRGALFRRAFVQAAVCGPSRASIYTGRYPHSHRSRFNEVPLGLGEKTIADYFNAAGFRSALVGRTHFMPITATNGFEPYAYYDGLPAKDPYSPYIQYLQQCGYSDEDISLRYWPKGLRPELGHEAYPEDFREAYAPSRIAAEHSDTAFLTDQALRFMREQGDQPWMLHVSYWKPHLPFCVSSPYHGMYDPQTVPMPLLQEDELEHKPPLQKLFREERRGNFLEDQTLLRQIRAVYFGMITEVDHHIGRLTAELMRLGLIENTLIVFTSDHGEYLGDHYMVEKELFYDQAIHVPLILSLPRVIPSGEVVEELVESIDILPTCLEISNITVPPCIQGRSLLPLFHGVTHDWRQAVFAEWDFQYYHCREQLGLAPEQCKAIMIRDLEWKYVHYTDQPCELYRLTEDPNEFVNLADHGDYQGVVQEMRARILNWRMHTEEKEPEIDLTYATYLRNPWEPA